MSTNDRTLHVNDFPIVPADLEVAQLPASGLESLQSRSRMKPTTPDYAAAWASIKDDIYVSQSEGQSRTSEDQIDSIEPGVRLLELSAAYRAAHALHVEAVAAENAAYKAGGLHPGFVEATEAAESALDFARNALLSAALDIT